MGWRKRQKGIKIRYNTIKSLNVAGRSVQLWTVLVVRSFARLPPSGFLGAIIINIIIITVCILYTLYLSASQPSRRGAGIDRHEVITVRCAEVSLAKLQHAVFNPSWSHSSVFSSRRSARSQSVREGWNQEFK